MRHRPENSLGACASVILAYAVTQIFPETKLIGGHVESYLFSYDFYLNKEIGESAIAIIEEKMRDIVHNDLPFSSMTSLNTNVLEYFQHHDQPYRQVPMNMHLVDLIQLGNFRDLGNPGNIERTKECSAIKLVNLVENFERVDGKEFVRVQIHGVVRSDKKELKTYLKVLKEYRKRDPDTIARKEQLFTQIETSEGVDWVWLPKGCAIKRKLIEHLHLCWEKEGFQEIFTHSLLLDAYVQCGVDLWEMAGKPVRIAETKVLADEQRTIGDGTLFSPFRQTTDVATVFLNESELQDGVISSLQFITDSVKILSFDGVWRLSAPLKSCQSDGQQTALVILRNAAEAIGLSIDETNADFDRPTALQAGETKGPFLEFIITDSLEREWVVSSIGINSDLNKYDVAAPPSMICLSVFGSWERLVALLIERHKGCLPEWLAE